MVTSNQPQQQQQFQTAALGPLSSKPTALVMASPKQRQYLRYLKATRTLSKDTLRLVDDLCMFKQEVAQEELFNLIKQLTAAPKNGVVADYEDFGIEASLFPKSNKKGRLSMLEKILKMYVMAMAGDVRSPLPHLVGPPGCGKSTAVEQAAELLGVNLHIINVSRISPLELEGAQMPNHDNTALTQLTATWWTQLKEGDIVLLDEFLRGFPEVYNGLLDILTSRQVAGFRLPKVFILGASNSVATYDSALEDRLLHLPVDDPRKNKSTRMGLAEELVKHIGLMPEMATSMEMNNLLDSVVLPMYSLLDNFKGTGRKVGAASSTEGSSVRKLIGQARLRMIQVPQLAELLEMNNLRAAQQSKMQYVVLQDPRKCPARYADVAAQMKGGKKLTPVQSMNLELNLQLLEMLEAKNDIQQENEEMHDDEIFK